ncbi:MAG: PG0541 family transporter-associated protein [Thermoanaerobaculales bacterium]|jgi:hypothetical protein|nr:PG0541 family transporter-associated protein [Thermoanaerobaculales bacterium]
MKLLMIIVESHCREELEVLLQRKGITGYTEIPGAHGVGASGVRMGSRAHPDTSSIFFTVVDEEQIGDLKESICSFCDAAEKKMHMIQWAVEEVV